jgi:predicted transcriptional regulator of viral defense system
MIASPKSKKTIDFQGTKIRFFKTKHMWGYKKQRYMDFDILVAEKEKCIIDSLLIKNIIFDEIVKAIGTKEFDSKKLVEYAIKTKNKSLMKRIGYLMGKFGFETEELIKHLDNNYILLDWNGIKKGERNKKWKIIVNRRLNDIY